MLVELQLLAGEVGIGWGTWRLLRSRRRELATLRALGWRRRQLAGRLLAEFAPTAVIAIAAAALAGYAIGAALAGRLQWAWLLLCVPAMIAAVIPRAPARARPGPAGAARGLARWRGRLPSWRSARPGRAGAPAFLIRRQLRLRAGSRRLLRTLVIAGASVALSLQVAARWAFAGAATSWTQRPVTGLGAFVDGAAVLIVVLMATFTVADLDWVALRERAVEVRTLRAIGWSALGLARLTLRNAVWPGLSGGLIAGGTDLLVGLPASGAAPLRLIALVALAAASGIALSLLANGLSTYSAASRGSLEKLTVHPRFLSPLAQIGNEELGIGWIAAHSPQAKGRIERCFGTLQDRLVKALRRARAAGLEEANRFLQQVYSGMERAVWA